MGLTSRAALRASSSSSTSCWDSPLPLAPADWPSLPAFPLASFFAFPLAAFGALGRTHVVSSVSVL